MKMSDAQFWTDAGNRIVQLRKAKKLSQAELGKKLGGISKSTILHYEGGKRPVPAVTLCKMAGFFGVSTDYLLGLTQTKKPYDDIVGRSGIHGYVIHFFEEEKKKAAGDAEKKAAWENATRAINYLIEHEYPLLADIGEYMRLPRRLKRKDFGTNELLFTMFKKTFEQEYTYNPEQEEFVRNNNRELHDLENALLRLLEDYWHKREHMTEFLDKTSRNIR